MFLSFREQRSVNARMTKAMHTNNAYSEDQPRRSAWHSPEWPGSQNRLRIGDLDLLTEALRE
jgi:hypothetical protein